MVARRRPVFKPQVGAFKPMVSYKQKHFLLSLSLSLSIDVITRIGPFSKVLRQLRGKKYGQK